MKVFKICASILLYAVMIFAVFILLIAFSGAAPFETLGIFFQGIFGNLNSFCEVFVKGTPLMLTGLACALAFRTGFFNIGAEGQFYAGAVAAAAVALRCVFIPVFLRLPLALLAGFLAGGLWSLLAAFMKLRFRISEIIVTIMLNYIAVNFVGVAVRTFLQDPSSGLPQSERLEAAMVLPRLITGTRLHAGFLIAAFMVAVIWFVLEKTTWGYEMRLVGFNPRAGQVNGIPVAAGVSRASVLSGGLAGLAGAIELMAVQKKLLEGFSGDCGYTGVLIALLAGNRPEWVPVSALLYAASQVGAQAMQRSAGVPSSMVSILIGCVVIILLVRSFLGTRLLKRTTGGLKRV